MIIGFDCFNFTVRQGFVVHNDDSEAAVEAIKACCGKPSQLVLLKTREQLDEVSVDYLLGIYFFFTGKKLKYDRMTGDKKELRSIVRQSFDISKLTAVEVCKQPAPTPAPKLEKETDTMATKKSNPKAAKKSAAKKPAKKAAAKKPAKKTDGAKKGRASKFAETAKIKALVKENPCNTGADGKLSLRGQQLDIIIKAGTITVADYLKKPGAKTSHIIGLLRKKYISVTG